MEIRTITVGAFEVNCYIVWGKQRQALVIDPGADIDRIEALLRDEELTLAAILLTHGHMDHVSGVAALAAAHGAQVYLHADDLAWAFTHENEYPPYYPIPSRFEAVVHWTDGEQYTMGGLECRVIATPGHTPGGVCLQIGDALFTGDTLFAGSAGRTDLPRGSSRVLKDSLSKLATLEGPLRVFPGHGQESTIEREKRTNFFLRQP